MFDFYLDLKLSEAGDVVERQLSALDEIIPVLSELRSSAQRLLYVQRLSDKLGINESAVLGEMKRRMGHLSKQEQQEAPEGKFVHLQRQKGETMPSYSILLFITRTPWIG